MEDLLPALQGSSSSTLGCGGDVSQRNLILQPSIPPARDVLAFSAQPNFLRDGKDWIFQDGEMQRKTLKESGAFCAFWALEAVLPARSILQVPTHSKGSRHTMAFPAQSSQIAATCSSLPEETAWEELKRKKKRKKEKAKPSMVIRMNCLELDNQK